MLWDTFAAIEDDDVAAQFVYDLSVEEQSELMKYPWPEDVSALSPPRWAEAWASIMLTAIERGELCNEDVGFPGDTTGGGGGTESTRKKDAAMTKLFRLVTPLVLKELKSNRKNMSKFVELVRKDIENADADTRIKLQEHLREIIGAHEEIHGDVGELMQTMQEHHRGTANSLASGLHAVNAAQRHLRSAQSSNLNAISTTRDVLEATGFMTVERNLEIAKLMELGRPALQERIATEFPLADQRLRRFGSIKVLADVYVALEAHRLGGPVVLVEFFEDKQEVNDDDDEKEALAEELMHQGKAMLKDCKKRPRNDDDGFSNLDKEEVNTKLGQFWDESKCLITPVALIVAMQKKPTILFNYGESSRTPDMLRHGKVKSTTEQCIYLTRYGDSKPRNYLINVILSGGGAMVLDKVTSDCCDRLMNGMLKFERPYTRQPQPQSGGTNITLNIEATNAMSSSSDVFWVTINGVGIAVTNIDTVAVLRQLLALKTRQLHGPLCFNGTQLDDSSSMVDCGIVDGSVIDEDVVNEDPGMPSISVTPMDDTIALEKLPNVFPAELVQAIENIPEGMWNKPKADSYRKCSSVHFGLGPIMYPHQVPKGSSLLEDLEKLLVEWAKMVKSIPFTSMIINRYAQGQGMGLHIDHNLPDYPLQIVSIFGEFKGGILECYDEAHSKGETDGVYILNANIPHHVSEVVAGTRYSFITYCKNIGANTPENQKDRVTQAGYPLP